MSVTKFLFRPRLLFVPSVVYVVCAPSSRRFKSVQSTSGSELLSRMNYLPEWAIRNSKLYSGIQFLFIIMCICLICTCRCSNSSVTEKRQVSQPVDQLDHWMSKCACSMESSKTLAMWCQSAHVQQNILESSQSALLTFSLTFSSIRSLSPMHKQTNQGVGEQSEPHSLSILSTCSLYACMNKLIIFNITLCRRHKSPSSDSQASS